MIIRENVSAQNVSWVKSNEKQLSKASLIEKLYYPESTQELVQLIYKIRSANETFEIIGYSSNTLFCPSYKVKNLICTKKINSFVEKDNLIVCECGVPVSLLSKQMIEKGYVGFEGLTDLPGTIAAAVYGNCGCRGCSVNSMLHHIEFLKEDGSIVDLCKEDLNLKYRSSILKQNELKGVVLRIFLNIVNGNPKELKELASKNHEIRKKMQPSGFNNLGTTFNGGRKRTLKGYVFKIFERVIGLFLHSKDSRVTFPKVLKIMGYGNFSPYVYYWNRYMFLDETSHLIFNEYCSFLKTLYKDVTLEIEIRK